DDGNDVGAGLPLYIDDDRGCRIAPGAELGIFRSADNRGDVEQADRGAVAIGDDQGAVLIDAGDLVVGIDHERLGRPVDTALRRIDVEIAERGADVVDVEPVCGKRLWIDLKIGRAHV